MVKSCFKNGDLIKLLILPVCCSVLMSCSGMSAKDQAEMDRFMEEDQAEEDAFFGSIGGSSSPKKKHRQSQKAEERGSGGSGGVSWAGYNCRVPSGFGDKINADSSKIFNAVMKKEKSSAYISFTVLPKKARKRMSDSKLVMYFNDVAKKEHRKRDIIWKKRLKRSRTKIRNNRMRRQIWLADMDGKKGYIEILSGTWRGSGDYVSAVVVAEKREFKRYRKDLKRFLSSCNYTN